MNRSPNIILVTGSYPDVGKGIFSSSIGYLLKTFGYKIQILKFDGYMNLSSGAMNPYHKSAESLYSEEEVFVLDDGYEGDADSGYYERFLHQSFGANSNITNGQLFKEIISLNTAGDILNYRKMRNLLKRRILNKSFIGKDFLIIEAGGTIGDKESEILLDCLSLLRQQEEMKIFTIMLAPCFYQDSAPGTELSYRSKNLRQAYEKLWRVGLAPKSVVLRAPSKEFLPKKLDLEYVALETGLSIANIFTDCDFESIYDLPASLRSQKLPERILDYYDLPSDTLENQHIEEYSRLLKQNRNLPAKKVAVFGKTMSYDTYVSLVESLDHAGVNNSVNIQTVWLDDCKNWQAELMDCSGLIVGEGLDNIREKVDALRYAYSNDIPTLAFSFGYSLMLKATKNIGIEELNDSNPKIPKSELFVGNINGERLRVMSIPNKCILPDIRDSFEYNLSDDIIFDVRSKNKRYFFGCIYHPEYKSHPMYPHPVIDDLIKEIARQK